MLPLRAFALLRPKTMAELSFFLTDADETCKIIAGGTDVIPNLKHGLYDLSKLIALAEIDELKHVRYENDTLCLGAMVSLERITSDQNIRERAPALAKAAALIASPQIRAMGTIGGNIGLDTRCAYFNQTEFWRKALGYCLKKDGTVCHVIKSGKRCVAASSNDLATMLLAYGASVRIFSPSGTRMMALADLYTANGEKNKVLTPKEVIIEVQIPRAPQGYAGFAKLRHRQSFDFPLLSIGAFIALEGERLSAGRLVVNALVAKPRLIDLAPYAGRIYDSALVEQIAHAAKDKCHPQSNIADDQGWRRAMIVPFTKRAFYDARPFRDQYDAV